MRIQIPRNGIQDKLIWTGAPNVEYSVKLGYKTAMRKAIDPCNVASSSCRLSNSDWKDIWRLKTLPRIQHFIWRCLNRVVATNANLFRRKKSKSPCCPICSDKEESIEHLLFHCPWTRYVWFGCGMRITLDANFVTNFTEWWLHLNSLESGLNEYDIAQVCWCLWQIWKGRNDLVFNQIKLNPCEVIEYTKKFSFEFFEATGYNQIPSPHPGTPLQIWTRPPWVF